MAVDRFITFPSLPPKAEVKQISENYLRDICTVDEKNGVLFITVKGRPTHPLFGISTAVRPSITPQPERWIEIHFGAADNTIDVLTRMQDALTKDIAQGLANILIRWYHGTAQY